MKKIFSLASIIQKLSLLAKRFPISILLVVGFAMLIFHSINDKEVATQLWFFFSIGVFISVTITLWLEDFKICLLRYGITLAVVGLWGVYCWFLPDEYYVWRVAEIIQVCVIGASAILAMFFVSFLKNGKDKAFWNFSLYLVVQLCLAVVFGGILFGGFSLAIWALESLFGMNIAYEMFANLAVVCFVLFSPIYFLANIPDKTAKHNDEIFNSKVFKILSLYILMPILAVYALILYAYLFKIIFTWELPNGWVSWLVSALAGGGLLVIMLLFPLHLRGENKFVSFFSRWFGVLILPLLALMTIGIFRRLGDYGITIHRGYLLLLNLWFYGVFIYLFLSKSRHIKWILISPVAIALLASVGFWSVPNVTKYVLTAETNKILNNTKILSLENAKQIFEKMDKKDAQKFRSNIEYLSDRYGNESIQCFFNENLEQTNRYAVLSTLGLYDIDIVEEVTESEYFSYYVHTENNTYNLGKWDNFAVIKCNSYRNDKENVKCRFKQDTLLIITLPERTISVPLRKMALEQLDKNSNRTKDKKELTIKNDGSLLFIKNFYGYYYPVKDSIRVDGFEGYLFYNK